MKETRTLDILAIAGSILALVVIALYVYMEVPAPEIDRDAARRSILRRLPDSPAKGDFELSSAYNEVIFPKAYKQRDETLRRVTAHYPNSAEVQFRAGSLGEGKQSVHALRRAAQLDRKNAAPLYLLAAEAASRKSWDEALRLLREGNSRPEYNRYPLAIGSVRAWKPSEQGLPSLAAKDFSASIRFLELERALGEHAADLHAAGRTDEALAILTEAKRVGWAVVRSKHAEFTDIVMGSAMIRIRLEHEEYIYKAAGSRAGLADVAREKRKVAYLLAGAQICTDQIMPHLMDQIDTCYAPMVAIAPLTLEVVFAPVLLALSAILALRTRRNTASALHYDATKRAFSLGSLLTMYALIFLPIGIAAALIMYVKFSASDPLWVVSTLTIAALLPSVLLHCYASRRCKRAYRTETHSEGADCPRLWRGGPLEEKREVSRRLAGVHGGAMVFLVMLGLLISCGIRLTLGAFPWQPDQMMERWRFPEQKLTADLVAGRIKVPESDIRKLER